MQLYTFYREQVLSEYQNLHKNILEVKLDEELVYAKIIAHEPRSSLGNNILQKYEAITREFQNQNKQF